MTNLLNIIGIAGALIVTYSNIPQMWLFIKQGHAKGISVSSTWIGGVGLALRTVYIAHTTNYDALALGPYFFALACIALTLYYIYFPKTNK